MYNLFKKKDRIQEKDNLFYVAMTRAEQSLALFIPQGKKPQKNSWLSRVDYFKKIENLIQSEEKDQWYFNSGTYDRGQYLLTVKNCQELVLEKTLLKEDLKSPVKKPDIKKPDIKKLDQNLEKSDGNLEEPAQHSKEQYQEQKILEKHSKTNKSFLFKSSQDFIEHLKK